MPLREHAVNSRLGRVLRRLEAVSILLASFGLAAFVVSHRPWVEHLLAEIGPFASRLRRSR